MDHSKSKTSQLKFHELKSKIESLTDARVCGLFRTGGMVIGGLSIGPEYIVIGSESSGKMTGVTSGRIDTSGIARIV